MFYLAGPYSVDPERMYERHLDAADRLMSAGHVVYSPIVETHHWHARFPHEYDEWIVRDLKIVACSCGLIRLPGESKGADMEVGWAESLGLPIWLGDSPVDDFIEGRDPTIKPKSKSKFYSTSILEEAEHITSRERNEDYGHPEDDFAKVVGMVNAAFKHKLSTPFEVEDWPLIMNMVKIAREIHKPKRDNRVDGAGYWNTLQMIIDRKANG